MPEQKIITVSELTRQIKGVLELGFSGIWVQGEISNCKLHSSGHFYFSLNDETSQIAGVMWRSRVSQLLFRPSDGMKVMVRGNVTVYEPRGSYQIDCLQIQPIGKGELQIAFEQLKQKLLDEGLFDAERKKPIPDFPRAIGIVTSPTGAAIHDILTVLRRRMPAVEAIVVPVKVQGVGAAEEIAEAIRLLNENKSVDVMIVGRGGGSMEDLWAFNEEPVARAVFASVIPVISAVGHEIDYSICDFVADLRAPTPSAAAEMAVKDRSDVVELIRNYCYTMNTSMTSTVESYKHRIAQHTHSYSFHKPHDILRQRGQLIDELQHRLDRSAVHHYRLIHQTVGSLAARIGALDPRKVLKRGYSILRQNGKIVSSVRRLTRDVPATVELNDGSVQVEISDRRE